MWVRVTIRTPAAARFAILAEETSTFHDTGSSDIASGNSFPGNAKNPCDASKLTIVL
jgi:hypothetical protein